MMFERVMNEIVIGTAANRQRIIIEVALGVNTDNQPVLSIVGNIGNHSYGQVQDHILEEVSNWWIDSRDVRVLVDIWHEYHLNDISVCCEHQRYKGYHKGTGYGMWYGNIGPTTVGAICDVCGAGCGMKWYHQSIPWDVLAKVEKLLAFKQEFPRKRGKVMKIGISNHTGWSGWDRFKYLERQKEKDESTSK